MPPNNKPRHIGNLDTPPFDDWIKPQYKIEQPDEQSVEKSGVLSSSFGKKAKRRKQLVSRLKGKRQYDPPVKGGKRRRKGHMGGNIVRGDKSG